MSEIAQAVQLLRSGGLVAFPTETVYGLGADATNSAAVQRIFAAKGRPSTNPLISHVADASVARRYAKSWPDSATRLAERFWPGPLTLVLEKTSAIVAEATAGLSSVALRCPDHLVALELLRAFDGPIAAPSANRSTRVSPTTAAHVRRQLGDRVDLILDGGACRVGIESTVLDLTRAVPMILRPGSVSREQIEAVIGPVELFGGFVREDATQFSPGQQEVHYSPHAPAYRYEPQQRRKVARWCVAHSSDQAVILSLGESELLVPLCDAMSCSHRLMEMPENPDDYAARLYAALHEADVLGVAAIFVEMPPDQPQWAAVRDRLMRATRPFKV